MCLLDSTPCPVPPESHEWLKILLAALAGLLTGLIADPIRSVIQWRINVLRMECAIGMDFLMLSIGLETVKHDLVPAEKFWMGLSLPAFEYYWEKNREMFYGSFELQNLRMQCMTVLLIKESVEKKQKTFEDAEAQLRETIAPVIKFKTPDKWHERVMRRIMLRFVR